MQSTISSTTAAQSWNGPTCQHCWTPYLGQHTCSREALQKRIHELMRLCELQDSQFSSDRTRNCPCRPENGGSGVCGCALGGPSVTC